MTKFRARFKIQDPVPICLDSFHIRIKLSLQTHFILEKTVACFSSGAVPYSKLPFVDKTSRCEERSDVRGWPSSNLMMMCMWMEIAALAMTVQGNELPMETYINIALNDRSRTEKEQFTNRGLFCLQPLH